MRVPHGRAFTLPAMTINSSTRSAGPFSGDGSTTAFAFAFKVFQAADLLVARTSVSLAQTVLALNTDYTVALNADQNVAPGGVVTLATALATGTTLDIGSNVAVRQPVSLVAGGPFLPKIIEDALDRLTVQQLQQGFSGLGQTLRVPEVGGVALMPDRATRASRLLGFNANGDPVANLPAPGDATALALDLLDSTNAAKGDALIAVKRTVANAVATTQHAVHEARVFDLKADFGAAGDGVTDDSAAFDKAMRAALAFFGASSLSAATIYIPPGNYLITATNFLGAIEFTTLPGGYDTRWNLTIRGAGWGSNIVWRPTSVGTDVWMYDNGASGSPKNILTYFCFQDLQITHDVVNLSGGARANGFRCLGNLGVNGVVQGFQFLHSRWTIEDYGNGVSTAKRAKCGTFMQVLGTLNCSEMTWTDSVIQAYTTVVDFGTTNLNALNYNFNNTSGELIFGDVFKYGAGGSLNVRGGSWIMESETTAYFLAMRHGSVGMTGACHFEGGRFELRVNSLGTYLSHWLLTDATGVPSAYTSSFPVVKFVGWASAISGSVGRNTFVVDAAYPAKITIDGCNVGDVGASQLHKVSVFSSKAGLQTANTNKWMAELDFINGDAVPFASVAFTDANSTARVSARNCRNTLDYDLMANGVCDQAVGRVRPLKTATIWGVSWPDLGNNSTMSIRLPKGALLKKCMFRKAANGGAATAGYRLGMVDGALNQYCASGAANQNTEHKALADNLNIFMDDAVGYAAGVSAPQDIYLIALPGALGSAQAVAMAKTDYALVDYY